MFHAVPILDSAPFATVGSSLPYLWRGIGRNWPARQSWTLNALCQRGEDIEITLVCGNREKDSTVFEKSTFAEYVRYICARRDKSGVRKYLKEFDILKQFPDIAQKLPYHDLFPKGVIRSHGAWIGAEGSRTGLHFDYLDNLAWLADGQKRFYLAPPGSIQKLGKISGKYDRWATLTSIDINDVHEIARGQGERFPVYSVDLEAGDCIFVPKGWWHQVENLTPSVFLGGFYGQPTEVLGKWAWTQMRQTAHELGFFRKGHCTCCAARSPAAKP